jgi:hypothetical protein
MVKTDPTKRFSRQLSHRSSASNGLGGPWCLSAVPSEKVSLGDVKLMRNMTLKQIATLPHSKKKYVG